MIAQEIGVHMFITKESGISFKHRMFTFQDANKIYRTYKLVLPHPQRDLPFTIRLIFTAQTTFQKFCSMVPQLETIVQSFSWLSSEKEQPNSYDFQSARNRFIKSHEEVKNEGS